ADQDLLAARGEVVLDELALVSLPAAADVDHARAVGMEARLAARGMDPGEGPLLAAHGVHDVDAESLRPVRREDDAPRVAAPARVAEPGAASVADEQALRARGQV